MKKTITVLMAIVLSLVMCAGAYAAEAEVAIVLQDDDIFLNVGESETLTALTSGGAAVTWTTSNDKVATVTPSGTVTAVGAGNARVTASVGDIKATAIVQVKSKSTSLLATATELELSYNDKTQELEYTLYYTGAILDNRYLTVKLFCTEYKTDKWVYDSMYSINSHKLSDLQIDGNTVKGSIRLGRQIYRSELFRDFSLEIVGGDAESVNVNGTATVYTYMTCAKASLAAERLGDVNGDKKINALDASIVLRYDVGLIAAINNGDVNKNGYADAFDASLILRYDVGLITSFEPWQK